MTETSKENKKVLENLKKELLEMMNDRGISATYLMSSLSEINNPENSAQIKLVKVSNSNRVNDLLKHNSIPITLHDNLLTFRDTNKQFELKGDLLKMITKKNYKVDHASLSVKNLMFDFAKEMHFHINAQGNKTRLNAYKITQIFCYYVFCNSNNNFIRKT